MEYNQCYDFELVIPWISVSFRLHHLFGTALDFVHVNGIVYALVVRKQHALFCSSVDCRRGGTHIDMVYMGCLLGCYFAKFGITTVLVGFHQRQRSPNYRK